MAKKREDIGVYFFEGFLEGGKTTYIQSLISDPQLPEDLRILILQTEEGMEELEPVPGREIFVEQLEGWDDVTPEHLAALEDKTECNTIMVELNGMWQELDFFKRMPENWYPFRKFVIADASTFVSYNNNMRALAADKLKESTVVVFNRADPGVDRDALRKIVRAASRHVPIYFQATGGKEEFDDTPIELPYDLNAPIVEIQDRDYAEWERDISEEPEKYDGKILRLRGFAVKSRDHRKGHFGFGRQVMTCCEADITFLGFPAVASAANTPVPGSWVELTAQVALTATKKGPAVPELMVITCDKVEKPEDTLATFY